MLRLNELQEYLNDSKSNFEIIEHDTPILSVKDAAKYFDSEKSIPVFIVQTEQGLMALIVCSQQGRIDFKAIGKRLGYNQFKMADRTEILRHTGYDVGSIPLIGHNLPCIFDSRLLVHDYIYGGTGDELHTLKIVPTDVARLNNVVHFIDL